MAFAHEPLDEAVVGAQAWRMVGPQAPPQAKKLAAKGLAPLPPRDLLVALYQLWATPAEEQSAEAAKTVEGLPPPILNGALDDPGLPPGVLDLLGRKFPRDEGVLSRIARHPAVDDQTLAGIARHCPESICDLIAENQDRWLNAPAIVESLYQNPNCRMSVAQRIIELAVREGVELSLPNMDEIRQAIGSGSGGSASESDEAFRNAATDVVASNDAMAEQVAAAAVDDEVGRVVPQAEAEAEAETEVVEELLDAEGNVVEEQASTVPADKVTLISQLEPMAKIRMALMGNAFERAVLIRDSNKSVAMSAIKSPRVRENEVEKFAQNRSLSHDVVRYIANKREWTKNYSIKLLLVLNPKTPMSRAMNFLAHLRAHDVRKVARSKNIPSSLARAAKRRMEQRR